MSYFRIRSKLPLGALHHISRAPSRSLGWRVSLAGGQVHYELPVARSKDPATPKVDIPGSGQNLRDVCSFRVEDTRKGVRAVSRSGYWSRELSEITSFQHQKLLNQIGRAHV